MTTKLDQLTSWLKEHKIIGMECLISDLMGIARGKISSTSKFIAEKDTRLSGSVLLQAVTGGCVEDDICCNPLDLVGVDMVCRPGEDTAFFTPWIVKPVAMVIRGIFDKPGNPAELSPRNILKRVLKMYIGKGWWPIVAPGMELYLTRRSDDPDYPLQAPVDRSGCRETGRQSLSTDVVNGFDPLFGNMYNWCEAQGLDLDTLIHEEDTAQMEINLRHGDTPDLADQILVFKRTVREVALKHNVATTFMAKLMTDEPGSATYLHQSIIDVETGKNIFSNAGGTMSELFLHYIGGLQKFIPEVLPLFVPDVSSSRRFLPDTSAPVNVEWGEENHTVGLRVLDSSPENRRVENRLAGADASPYLALAASLSCGYIGMVESIKPSARVGDRGYGRRNPRLSLTIEAALECMESCKPLEQYLGSKFISGHVAMKRTEHKNFKRVISSWEREFLLLSV